MFDMLGLEFRLAPLSRGFVSGKSEWAAFKKCRRTYGLEKPLASISSGSSRSLLGPDSCHNLTGPAPCSFQIIRHDGGFIPNKIGWTLISKFRRDLFGLFGLKYRLASICFSGSNKSEWILFRI